MEQGYIRYRSRRGFEWKRQCKECAFEHPYDGICTSDSQTGVVFCLDYTFDNLYRKRFWKYCIGVFRLNLNMGANYVLTVFGVI